jgi:hypothetical protein
MMVMRMSKICWCFVGQKFDRVLMNFEACLCNCIYCLLSQITEGLSLDATEANSQGSCPLHKPSSCDNQTFILNLLPAFLSNLFYSPAAS